MKNAILGVNHQFLYPEAITDAVFHTETLRKAAELDLVDALDCWVWRGQRAREEIAILRGSNKIINYNIGDRAGEKPCFPCSTDKADRIYAYDTLMREVEYALAVGAKKIVFASGPDLPEDREGAKERLGELIVLIAKQLPRDVVLALEPTDRDIDKHFLLGPLDETVDFIKKVVETGRDYLFLTNNSSHNAKFYVEKLRKMGLVVEKSRVLTSGEATAAVIKKMYPGKRAFVLGNEYLVEDMTDAGIVVDNENPEIVVENTDAACDNNGYTDGVSVEGKCSCRRGGGKCRKGKGKERGKTI